MNAVSMVTGSVWEQIQGDLQSQFPHDVYTTWFQPIRCLKEADDSIVLGVESEFASIWIQDNYLELIRKKLQMARGYAVEVSLQVEGVAESRLAAEMLLPETPLAQSDRSRIARTLKEEAGLRQKPLAPQGIEYVLNPKNTFENFVVGAGNQLAHAASIAVANSPARAYNPLFLYGDTGLGKTHLMHAIAHQVFHNNPKARVAYISTEKFTNEFIRAIQENDLIKFRQRYRSVDLLLIDDIHFLSGKERIQEEFFHTFNELFESQKQVVLTSDRPAGEIAKLENRLISRFQWGLVADIQIPDFETRVAILTSKAASIHFEIPNDVLQFLAKHVSRNVRRMEGALTRVAGYAALTKGRLTVPVIEKLLRDILQEEAQSQVTMEFIQQKVVDYFHLRLADMLSKRRPANIAFPRQIAMYLCRLLTSHSLQEIGETFGGRDHGTVIHACKTVENMMQQDASVKRSVEYLHNQIAKGQ